MQSAQKQAAQKQAVADSYEYCVRVARKRAKNFYYSFLLLSGQQRKSMCAIYAFMRYCDDLSDDPLNNDPLSSDPLSSDPLNNDSAARRAAIEQWRAEMEEALEGRFSGRPVWPAFHHTVRRFGIPHEYFRSMIDGVLSDLEPRRIQTFDELYHYCYQVASVVGLTIVHIFGFDTRTVLPLAEKCGVAFQLTNILRDIREDAALGRVYLPAEDLRRFEVTEESLRAGERSEAFLRLMRFEAARARAYYTESRPLLDLIHPRSRPSLLALVTIYSNLLDRIERTNFDVFRRRVRLTLFEKSWIVVRALVT